MQRARFTRDTQHSGRDARVHGAQHHVYLVARDQAVDVVGGFRRLGFVVHLDEFDLSSREFSTGFLQREAKTVLDGDAQRRIGTGIGQHQAHLDLCSLGARDVRKSGHARCCGTGFEKRPAVNDSLI